MLYLTNKLRRHPDSGGARREHELLRRLVARFDIHYVAFTPDYSEEAGAVAASPLAFASTTVVAAGDAVPPASGPSLPERISSHAAPIGREVIAWLARSFAPRLVHCEGYFLMQHLPENLGLPIVLQEENIEFELDRDRTRVQGDGQTGAGVHSQAEEIEVACWRRASACIAVTREDADILRARAPNVPTVCLVNGGETAPEPLAAPESGRALYVANFKWAPSRDACCYLLEEIWPRVRQMNPGAGLLLAGAEMDAGLRHRAALAEGVEIESPFGTFSEVASRCALLVSPLRFGGGHKMKIVEALCAGLPIVATPLSLRGFGEDVQRAVAATANPTAFAALTAALLTSPEVCRNMARASLLAARELPGWDQVADGLADVWLGALTPGLAAATAPPSSPARHPAVQSGD
ncbi:hypothetical protein GCM10007285_25310 [Stappia taiwanensis]|nr:hypothetical protein GCM10007285_25310 [Stappia taiwanensis]